MVQVTCSAPECDDEFEVMVESLDELEAIVCECEHCVVVLTVADFQPRLLATAST